MKNEEIWKPIKGYEGQYEVSSFGRVKSLSRKVPGRNGGLKPIRERILKSCIIRGYENVILCQNGKNHKHGLVHRLVAQAFIPNEDNKPNIDHIDCNTLNNKVENLRWCTQKENCNNPITRERDSSAKKGKGNPYYGKRNEEIHNARKVACFTKGGKFINTYPSVAEASRQTGIRASNISACANEYHKSAGNFIWRYL